MKTKIEVEITEIKADERYFSFNYVIRVGGEIEEKGSYESDYENGNTPAQQIAELKEDNYAVSLALGQAFS